MAKKTEVNRIVLTREESERLEIETAAIVYPKSGSYEPFIRQSADAVRRALNAQTREALWEMKNNRSPIAPVVFEGLPFDALVTRGMLDPEGDETGKSTDLSEVLLIGIVAQIGEPYAIKQEGRGLVSNLSPKKSHLLSHTGLGSINELGLHIENAAGRLLDGDRAPDGLALIGVSKERDLSPGTIVADGREAMKLVDQKHLQVLQNPKGFALKAPERWRSPGADGEVLTAVVTGDEAYPTFIGALYGDMLRPLSSEAEAALAAFSAAINDVSVDLQIEPGMLALLDNRVVWHGRRGFRPAFDEEGCPFRFLQRVFWTSGLRRFGDWPRERGRLIMPTL